MLKNSFPPVNGFHPMYMPFLVISILSFSSSEALKLSSHSLNISSLCLSKPWFFK